MHRLLVETYGEAALSESCREWFQKFKNGEFDIEDKERSGRSKVYEDAELEAFWIKICTKRKMNNKIHNKSPIFDKKNGGNLFVHLIHTMYISERKFSSL